MLGSRTFRKITQTRSLHRATQNKLRSRTWTTGI